jgi:hypothetical protein
MSVPSRPIRMAVARVYRWRDTARRMSSGARLERLRAEPAPARQTARVAHADLFELQRIGRKPAPSTSLRRLGGINAGAHSRRVWRWAFALALITLAGCEGDKSPVAPASDLPPGCTDEFSGLPTRGCL